MPGIKGQLEYQQWPQSVVGSNVKIGLPTSLAPKLARSNTAAAKHARKPFLLRHGSERIRPRSSSWASGSLTGREIPAAMLRD